MAKKKILVIENDSDIREIIRFYLQDEGFEVIEATRGEDALTVTEKENPDLITIDIMLGGIDGFEVIRCLKNNSLTANIHIIIISVLAKDKRIRDPIAGYLTKPFEKEELVHCVKEALLNLEKSKQINKKILVVDDEPDVVEIITAHLKDNGFLSIKAFDGKEAIDKAKNERPDLIILDIKMPKLNGFEVIKILKSDKDFWSIPIIVLTGTSISDEEKRRGLNLGVAKYLTKPFDAKVLIEEVKEVICHPKK